MSWWMGQECALIGRGNNPARLWSIYIYALIQHVEHPGAFRQLLNCNTAITEPMAQLSRGSSRGSDPVYV
jgi:hypothetical protein